MRKSPLAFAVLMLAAFVLAASPLWAANFLWSVKTRGGNQVYLMGSIHLAHEGLYPLNPAIMDAFGRSSALAVEINTLDMDMTAMQALLQKEGFYSPADSGRNLFDDLSAETAAILAESGLAYQGLEMMKPWLASLVLQTQVLTAHGYNEDYGLDKFFMRQAKERRLPIREMETLEQQFQPVMTMDSEAADLFVRATLLELAHLPALVSAMLDAWVSGDAAAFERLFFAEYDQYPELLPLLDTLIFRRNETMTAKIAGYLRRRDQVTFIVVGAGHLVGPRGILAALANAGYTVEQL